MQLTELRSAIDEALWNRDVSRLSEFQAVWAELEPQTPESYRPVITDRMSQLQAWANSQLREEWERLSARMDEVEPGSAEESETLAALERVEAALGPDAVEALINAA